MGTSWVDQREESGGVSVTGVYLSGVELNSASHRCGLGQHIGQRLTHVNNIRVLSVHDVLTLRTSGSDLKHGTQTLLFRFASELPSEHILSQVTQEERDALSRPPTADFSYESGAAVVAAPLPFKTGSATPDLIMLPSSPAAGADPRLSSITTQAGQQQSSLFIAPAGSFDIGSEDVKIEKQSGETLGGVIDRLILKNVVDGSVAARHNLQRFIGQRLTHINGKPVETLDDVKTIVDSQIFWLRFAPVNEYVGQDTISSSATQAAAPQWNIHDTTPRPGVHSATEMSPVLSGRQQPQQQSSFRSQTVPANVCARLVASINARDLEQTLLFFTEHSVVRNHTVPTSQVETLKEQKRLRFFFNRLFSALPFSKQFVIVSERELDGSGDTLEALAVLGEEGDGNHGSVTLLMQGMDKKGGVFFFSIFHKKIYRSTCSAVGLVDEL